VNIVTLQLRANGGEQLCTLLEQHRHQVTDFEDAAELLTRIHAASTDLLIADVAGDGDRDGLHIAMRASALLGSSPPKTLLLTRNGDLSGLSTLSPSILIGIVEYPADTDSFMELIDCIELTRRRCPGALSGMGMCFCRRTKLICRTADYTQCELYNEHCGRRFQNWVSTRSYAGQGSG